ncbi:MAG: sensor histidine kinase, partial [Candidatus Limnocylindrales bacterium]
MSDITEPVVAPAGAAPADAPSPDVVLVRNVRRRLVVWSGGTTLLVLIALGVAIYVSVAGSLAATATAQLETRAGFLRDFIEQRRTEPGGPPTGLTFGGGSSGTFALIVAPDGSLVGSQGPQLAGLPDTDGLAAARAGSRDIRLATVERTPVRIWSETAVRDNVPYVVQVVQDRTAEQRTLDVLLVVLIGGGLLAVLVAAVVGALYARRALVPIRESLGARRVALERQREFAADASHELRTPLTVINSSVEYLQRNERKPVAEVGSALVDIADEVRHLTGLVDDLLLLARSDSGAVELERRPLDFGSVAAEAVPGITQLAARRGVRIEVDPEPAPILGDELRLRQLVLILVDNAVRHSPDGAAVRVQVRQADGAAWLRVEDQGAGVRPEDRAHIFDRFWKAPGTASRGAGLGLAIASWIAQRHGGSISVEDAQPTGARFVVRLPAAPPKPVTP